MRKDRNTFFQEAGMYNANYIPNQINPNMMPMAQGGAYNNYYYGSDLNNNDLESRLSRIERQINRLESRLSKLENAGITSIEDVDSKNTVYMI